MTYKFTVQTTHEASEVIADAMFDLGGMGVCIHDPKDFDEIDKTGAVWDYVDESDKVGKVSAEGFFDVEDPEEKLHELKERFAFVKENFPLDAGTLETRFEVVPEVNWLEEWKQFYKPIHFEKFDILPAWMDAEREVNVRIQPGQIFGTGEHESTKICLTLLERCDLQGKTIADVGCGSGIIGLAGLTLGAKKCYFSDLDPKAEENVLENLALNGQEGNFEFKVASLLSGFNKKVDIIFANITADILTLLAPQTKDCLAEGGRIVVSGIIESMNDQVLKTYDEMGYKIIDRYALNDWRGYIFERK